MSKLGILASLIALAMGTAACGNSQGQSNSLVDVGPSTVSSTPSQEGGGNLATLAKGGNGGNKGSGGTGGGTAATGNSSLTLVMVSDTNGNGLPNWGDSIRWDVSTTATSEPNVSVSCWQNSNLVYSAGTGYYASYPWPWTQIMTLSSSGWQSGAASCTATLSYISGTSSVTLTSISFNVGA